VDSLEILAHILCSNVHPLPSYVRGLERLAKVSHLTNAR
jgi:hypothetical protein